MNNQYVSTTPKNKVKYPLHRHKSWEILYYLSGKGYLETPGKNLFFEPGTIIVVPPKLLHGSVSENGFKNISMGGDYGHLFMTNEPFAVTDPPNREGKILAELIYANRFSSPDYLSALCTAFIRFILQNSTHETQLSRTVSQIIVDITEHFSDPNFNVTSALNKSGYAEDYIRAKFKEITNKTPIRFLTEMRVEHAKKLFEIYGYSRSVAEIAEGCGYNDPIYFTRVFKKIVGISPDAFRTQAI